MSIDSWPAAILQRLALDSDALLILALDPDDLLLEEPVLMALREMGVGLLNLDPRDPIAFRYAYEADYRRRWHAGECPRLVVRLRGTDPNGFPYDLLARAGGQQNVRSLSLPDFFPGLAYPVLQELGRHDRRALGRLHAHYNIRPPDYRLGPQRTRRYLLEGVYEVTPQMVRTPTDLVRYLLRRHRQGQRPPPSLDAVLLEWWWQEPNLAALPLEDLLQDASALYRHLEVGWPQYLIQQGLPLLREDGHVRDIALTAAFDDREVQAHVGTLFLDGQLRPARLREPAEVYGWMQAGVVFDKVAYRAERLRRLLDHLEESLPDERDDHHAWLSFAPRWAEALRLRGEVDLAPEKAEGFGVLHDRLEDRFGAWLKSWYATVCTVSPIPTPVVSHQVGEALAYRLRQGEAKRLALLVLDGLAWDQWLVLRQALELEPLEESGLFAWVPTLTSIGRQALFAGQSPYTFADTWKRTDADERRWRAFWQRQGLLSPATAYACDPQETELETLLADRRVRVLGVVMTAVDQIMHGVQTGTTGLQQQVRQWAGGGDLARLLDTLRGAGFACWLTSDHGNIEASGIGVPREGILVEKRGQRVRIYQSEDFRQRAHLQVSQAVAWTPEGLPDGVHVLLAPGRRAFLPSSEAAVCHGGIALEEVVVPFVRL